MTWREELAALLSPGPNVVRMSDYRTGPTMAFVDETARISEDELAIFLSEIAEIHQEAVLIIHHDNDN